MQTSERHAGRKWRGASPGWPSGSLLGRCYNRRGIAVHNGEPCSNRDAICAVLTAIRESVREMRDDVKSVHAGAEAVNRVLERHSETAGL